MRLPPVVEVSRFQLAMRRRNAVAFHVQVIQQQKSFASGAGGRGGGGSEDDSFGRPCGVCEGPSSNATTTGDQGTDVGNAVVLRRTSFEASSGGEGPIGTTSSSDGVQFLLTPILRHTAEAATAGAASSSGVSGQPGSSREAGGASGAKRKQQRQVSAKALLSALCASLNKRERKSIS